MANYKRLKCKKKNIMGDINIIKKKTMSEEVSTKELSENKYLKTIRELNANKPFKYYMLF